MSLLIDTSATKPKNDDSTRDVSDNVATSDLFASKSSIVRDNLTCNTIAKE